MFHPFLSLSRVPFNPRYSKQWSENVHKQQPPGSFKTAEWHRAEGETGSREHDSDVLQRLLQGEHSMRGAGLTRLSGFCWVMTECQREWDWNTTIVLILASWNKVTLYEVISAAERFQLRQKGSYPSCCFSCHFLKRLGKHGHMKHKVCRRCPNLYPTGLNQQFRGTTGINVKKEKKKEGKQKF